MKHRKLCSVLFLDAKDESAPVRERGAHRGAAEVGRHENHKYRFGKKCTMQLPNRFGKVHGVTSK